MSNSLADTYIKALSGLEGDPFQDAVSALIGQSIRGFQTVPDKPQGDGGLDGFSHGGTVAYCCYGPEYSAAKTTKDRVKAVIAKFAKDMRRLFELDTDKTKLVHCDNEKLPKILPSNTKILEIRLIVNWFDDNEMLNPLHSLVPEYVAASKCNFVDKSVSMRIIGPKELVNEYQVDQAAVARIQHRGILDRVQNRAKGLALSDAGDFDAKMKALRVMRPGMGPAIDALEETFRENWKTSLAFENELDATVPSLRRSFDNARSQIVGAVSAIVVSAPEGSVVIDQCRRAAVEILERDFAKQYGDLVPALAEGEIARLIGECPIEFRKGGGTNATPTS